MIIYVDKINHCHIEDIGDCIEVETSFFDGKCREFIEGHCCEKKGSTTTIYPWKPYSELETIQTAVDNIQYAADEKISTLLDTIEELIIGG